MKTIEKPKVKSEGPVPNGKTMKAPVYHGPQAGRLAPEKLVAHRFALGEIMKAYDAFANAK